MELDVYDDKDNLYLVLESMEGGDLMDKTEQLLEYTERDAGHLALCVIRNRSRGH
jgi:serine/threonine protein kinase